MTLRDYMRWDMKKFQVHCFIPSSVTNPMGFLWKSSFHGQAWCYSLALIDVLLLSTKHYPPIRSNLTFHAFNNLESTQSRRHGKDLVGLPLKQRSKPLKLKYETL